MPKSETKEFFSSSSFFLSWCVVASNLIRMDGRTEIVVRVIVTLTLENLTGTVRCRNLYGREITVSRLERNRPRREDGVGIALSRKLFSPNHSHKFRRVVKLRVTV